MAEKFVKAVAKPSRPDMNPIRYYVYFNFYIYIINCSEGLTSNKGFTDSH